MTTDSKGMADRERLDSDRAKCGERQYTSTQTSGGKHKGGGIGEAACCWRRSCVAFPSKPG